MEKIRANRNRTLVLTAPEKQRYENDLMHISAQTKLKAIENRIINQDTLQISSFLPREFVDLLILDPPYNLNKTFKSVSFKKKGINEYAEWFEDWFIRLLPMLKKSASVYVCSDWYSSTPIHLVLEKYLKIRNRITWEREKGRGAKRNWKNASEDIWFATVSNEYVFNVEDVKIKRKVLAPYTDSNGKPKDWQDTSHGQFRSTHPSNLWTDITIPFWSMPENTDHPTQKPEKLLAKLILASTRENNFVFDPFMGVGSSVVVAKKLNRKFLGIEIEQEYCLLAAKRLRLADLDENIQGYQGNVFWERNTLNIQNRKKESKELTATLF